MLAYLVWGLGLRGCGAGVPARDPSPMLDLRPLIAGPPLPYAPSGRSSVAAFARR
jgi:hypothetical protein